MADEKKDDDKEPGKEKKNDNDKEPGKDNGKDEKKAKKAKD